MHTAAVIIMLFITAAFLSLFTLDVVNGITDYSSTEQSAFLDNEAGKISNWYKSNIMNIDSIPGQVVPPDASGRWSTVVLASNRVNCDSTVLAHKYAIVLPGVNGLDTTMDVETGAIAQGAQGKKYDQVRLVDGCQIAYKMVTESRQRAASLATTLENYFRGEELIQTTRGGQNFFASPACGGWGAIPCVTAASAVMLTAYLGVSSDDCIDAYGNYMYFDNSSANVNTAVSPFSARIGFIAPWGTTIWTVASVNN